MKSRNRAYRCATAVLGGCTLLIATAAHAQPRVTLAAWQSPTGTGMRFVGLQGELVAQVPDGTDFHAMQDGGNIAYAVDTSGLSWGPDCTCYRYYVVYVRLGNTTTRYKFRGIPSGSFDDQRAPVRLTVDDGTESYKDDLGLPVASAPGLEPPLVQVRTSPTPLGVSLGGVTELELTLVNTSKHLHVEIPGEISVTPARTQYWKTSPAFESVQYPIKLDPQRTKVLKLRLEPYVGQAVSAAFPPTVATTPHTLLHVAVPYSNPLFDSRVGTVETDVSLRFQPGLIALGLSLFVGVLVGRVVPVLAGVKSSGRQWLRAIATALVVGMILEGFGMVAVQNNSKVMLFGFEVDPWQSLSVALLGVLMGLLGLRAGDSLQNWLNNRSKSWLIFQSGNRSSR